MSLLDTRPAKPSTDDSSSHLPPGAILSIVVAGLIVSYSAFRWTTRAYRRRGGGRWVEMAEGNEPSSEQNEGPRPDTLHDQDE